MGTVDFKTERTFDRRIGQRLELDGIDVIDVSWVVSQSGRFGRRKPPLELPGRIENVSVTGAAIVGPSELALKPGDEAVVRCGGRDNIVSIRHCEPTADERTVRYGVEITSVQPNLKQRIRELLDPTLARMPVESAPPGRLSLRSVARPTTSPPPVEAPAPVGVGGPAESTASEPLADAPAAERPRPAVAEVVELPCSRGGRPRRDRARTLSGRGGTLERTGRPRRARPHRRHDGGARGCGRARPHRVGPAGGRGRTVDRHPGRRRRDRARPGRRTDRRGWPEPEPQAVVEPEPQAVIEPEPQAVVEPEPDPQAAVEPDPLPAIEPAAASGRDPHVPVAQPVHLPPVEMSEGRRVLDEVFGLMED